MLFSIRCGGEGRKPSCNSAFEHTCMLWVIKTLGSRCKDKPTKAQESPLCKAHVYTGNIWRAKRIMEILRVGEEKEEETGQPCLHRVGTPGERKSHFILWKGWLFSGDMVCMI